jgi:hypothetical protein
MEGYAMRPWITATGLLALVLLSLFSGACVPKDDGLVVDPPGAAPVVVRGAYSYVLLFDAENGSVDLQDSVSWYPELAYLSITVANHSSGSGSVEITNAWGMRLCLDSINGNMEILNRNLSSTMPFRLRLHLHEFTGAITCGLQLGPADINGMVTRFVLRDSTGLERSVFSEGERIDLSFSLANLTGRPYQWAKGDGRPMCRFKINGGDVLLRDSFEGYAWIQVPQVGTLQNGESIRLDWSGVLPDSPLRPGHYVAVAEPQFVFTELGLLRGRVCAFDIRP